MNYLKSSLIFCAGYLIIGVSTGHLKGPLGGPFVAYVPIIVMSLVVGLSFEWIQRRKDRRRDPRPISPIPFAVVMAGFSGFLTFMCIVELSIGGFALFGGLTAIFLGWIVAVRNSTLCRKPKRPQGQVSYKDAGLDTLGRKLP